jgi:hypothetical protein
VADAVIALGLATPVAATALLVAVTGAPRPLPSFILLAWLVAVTEVVVLGLALSPIRAVDRTGYALGELTFLAGALAGWLWAGRPLPPVPSIPRPGDHPILVVLAVAVGLSLVYELVLCLTVAPNNWDSLTYHLSRAASWYQHRRVGWIHNAPTERQNAFPVNSELALLWSFIAIRSDRLAALPQFLAQLAALVATYGIAVRVGFRRSSAIFAALLLATFSLVALESTTTQNDLVLASLVAACAYFLLGATPTDGVLAALAIALALGTKLTAVLMLPVLLALGLAARPSKRTIVVTLSAAVVGILALCSWLYIQNVEETGRLLGTGEARVAHSPALTAVGWLATVIRVIYRLLDFSGFEGVGPRFAVAAVSIVVAAIAAATLQRLDLRLRARAAAKKRYAVAMLFPVVWPFVVLGAAMTVYVLLRGSHFPIDPSGTSEGVFSWRPSTRAHEDFSYFGPLGAMLLIISPALLARSTWRRWPTRAVLAACLPVFVVGLALVYRFNEFLGRFIVLPVVLGAALLGLVYERRTLAAGVATLAVAVLVLTHLNNELKPMRDAPWSLSRARTLELQTWQAGIGAGLETLDRAVPADACLGAALGGDDASYPLFGPHLRRRITYVALPAAGTLGSTADNAVVIGPGQPSLQPGAAWRVSSLGGYWRLALRAGVARPFACRAASISSSGSPSGG